MAKILLTGGAGYIGSHTYLALIDAGYEVVIFDNFSNAKSDVPSRLQDIAGEVVHVFQGDVLNRADLAAVFTAHQIDGVVHLPLRKRWAKAFKSRLSICTPMLAGC